MFPLDLLFDVNTVQVTNNIFTLATLQQQFSYLLFNSHSSTFEFLLLLQLFLFVGIDHIFIFREIFSMTNWQIFIMNNWFCQSQRASCQKKLLVTLSSNSDAPTIFAETVIKTYNSKSYNVFVDHVCGQDEVHRNWKCCCDCATWNVVLFYHLAYVYSL